MRRGLDAGELLEVGNDSAQGVPIVRVAVQCFDMEDELAALGSRAPLVGVEYLGAFPNLAGDGVPSTHQACAAYENALPE
jgi:hypothetical protein